ncbi:ChbG/HpnK family deacetylase [Latilactobacillus sakei]
MRSIIVESDDFGMTIPISRAIILALKRGLLSATNAQVTSPDFAASAVLAQQMGIQGMGLHLVLDKDVPICDPQNIPSLVTTAGRLMCYANLQARVQELDLNEVRREFQAQIDCFLASGLKLTHLTSHHFVATLTPAIYAVVLELAQTYQVPLRHEVTKLPLKHQAAYQDLWQKSTVKTTGALITAQQGPYLTPADIQQQLLLVDQTVPPVILSHVGYLSSALRQKSSLTTNRLVELETLKTLQAMAYWQRNNWQLIDYSVIGVNDR